MRYELTESAAADFRKLTSEEKERFRQAVRLFNQACDSFVQGRGGSRWPQSLRIKSVVGAPGIWEMTWSFSGPDGRATWEWITVTDDDGEHSGIRWRRIGTHSIFQDP